MKRRVTLATINADSRRLSLSIEFLAARIYSDYKLRRKICLIKKAYPAPTSPEKIIHQTLSRSPHLIGFSCYVWNMEAILELASEIKENLPETLIVIGGPETAGLEEKILQEYPCINGVVVGEGEETFARWLAG